MALGREHATGRVPGDDWSGRCLHFVGIGGAGMSGLALIADTLGATVTGSDRKRVRVHRAAARTRHRTGARPRRGQRPRRRPGRVLDGRAGEQSGAPGGEGARAASGRPAGRDSLAAPLPGCHRDPRQDDDDRDDRPRHALLRSGPELRRRCRAARHRAQRRVGHGRVDRHRSRRIRSVAAQARPRGGGPDQRRARPPLDLRLTTRRRGDLSPVHGAGRRSRGGLGPAAAARAVSTGCGPVRRGRSGARAERDALCLAGDRGRALRCPAPTTRSMPPGR